MQRGRITFIFKAALVALASALVLGLLPGNSTKVYAEIPLFFTQPYLVSPEPQNSMFICWLTSEPTQKSYVEYGRFKNLSQQEKAVRYEIKGLKTVDTSNNYTVSLDGKIFQQIVHLRGLQPGTRYHYRAVSVGQNGKVTTQDYDFKTAPHAGAPFKFVLLSDLQQKPQIPTTVKMAGQQGADLIIYNGDLVNHSIYVGEWFSYPGADIPEGNDHRWFNVMQQTADGSRLLQYVPTYPSPGNHEIDEQDVLSNASLSDRQKLTLKIYMQLFRPLYPEQQYGPDGKHWYSADFGDLHITSLTLNRWFGYPKEQAPGWYLFDGIQAGSPQYNWLKHDLKAVEKRKYIWVTEHWHMFNRPSQATDVPYTDPVLVNGVETYPADQDYLIRDIKPLYEKYGVNAVSFGHSHVYERYLFNGVNYIEAANIGNTYVNANDPMHSGQGEQYPVTFTDCRFRSFMLVNIDPITGMTAKGIQTSAPDATYVNDPDLQGNYIGRVFDEFTVAPPLRWGLGNSKDGRGK